jgi:hypothetical protein
MLTVRLCSMRHHMHEAQGDFLLPAPLHASRHVEYRRRFSRPSTGYSALYTASVRGAALHPDGRAMLRSEAPRCSSRCHSSSSLCRHLDVS